ncbi:serine protease HTRA3-like isoform X2 [Melanotaenia boesemani]|uniref:serine protease HTRA3-like isoform X2 n=1 Tax=Melanotaenia boesemani TaxID=1250792 RepID=UPI001C047068|nr:serine protease HTRA3-like isoform X2 [Melanotaenia boesemani]
MSVFITMQLVFLTAAFLFTYDLAGAVRSDKKCAARCDVSSCPSPSCPGGYVPDRCNCCLVCSPREGDPCGRKNDLPCGDGLECKLLAAGRRRGSKGVCRCKTDHEVCGSDGKTYGNVCKLKAASRKAAHKGRHVVSQAHKGSCLPPGAGSSLVDPSSPRYKFNFIADVVEKIAPAVVHIELFVRHPLFRRHTRLSSGSGFIVTHAGVIVTNAHVVTTPATVAGRPQLRVQLHDGDAYEAVVRDIDRKADIATIKVNPQKKLHVLSLGCSADLRPGEFVVAIGSPFALQNTVTTGIVSTAQRDGKELGIKDSDMDYIQTDAIINVNTNTDSYTCMYPCQVYSHIFSFVFYSCEKYGNSGGPLVNLDGEVIGINTLKVTAGISFAIPSDRISHFLSESQAKHSKEKARQQTRRIKEPQSDADVSQVKRYFLGIRMITITKDLMAQLKHQNPDFPEVSSGVVVQEVIPNSPAESGGIKAGDVIVKLNGQPVQTTEDIHDALQSDRPLLLEVHRGSDNLLFNIHPEQLVH